MSEEYGIERTFLFADTLENGQYVFRTEYGSLLTESMLKEGLLDQFEKARRHLTLRGKQQLHIRFEVADVQEQEGGTSEENRTIERIRAMWVAEGSGGYDNYPGVVCPYCEETNASSVHFDVPQYFPGHDKSDASHIYDIGVRGDVMVLGFECEEGHKWVLVLGAHKGSISCKIELLSTTQEIEP